MLTLKFSSSLFLSAFSLLFFLMLSDSNAQSKSRNSFEDSVSTVLQKKLLLTDSQKLEIKNILIDYLNQSESKATITDAHNKISKVLDKRQKAKYEIIKNEWWQDISKKKIENAKK